MIVTVRRLARHPLPLIFLVAVAGKSAVQTHLRVGNAFFGPLIFSILIWGGLYLRDPRLRVLIPRRT
jgi:hypothetical protein